MPRPVDGRRKRVTLLRAALPCLVLSAIARPLKAQTLTPDLLRPVREGFLAPQDLFLRKTNDRTGENAADQTGDPTIDGERKNKTRAGAFAHRRHSEVWPAGREWRRGGRL